MNSASPVLLILRAFILRPSSFVLRPSSFIRHPPFPTLPGTINLTIVQVARRMPTRWDCPPGAPPSDPLPPHL